MTIRKKSVNMKSTGIVRQIDNLGRIVIPMEVRRTHNIRTGDPIEIYLDGDAVVLKKFQTSCVLCNSSIDLQPIGDKLICPACARRYMSAFLDAARVPIEHVGFE